jgi:hypothetical protein
MQTDPFEMTDTTCMIVVLVLIMWTLICIWVYVDARKRGMNGILWVVVVLVGSLIGLIVYIVVREEKRGKIPPDVYQGHGPPQQGQISDLQTHYTPRIPQTGEGSMCKRCGAPLGHETKFCPNCGLRT